ncbi:hypothetical protein D3C80_1276370 [compost metagenome]
MQARRGAGHRHILLDAHLHGAYIDIGQAPVTQCLLQQRRGKCLQAGNPCQGVSYIFRSSLLMTQRPVQCQKKVDIGAFQPICKLAGNEGIDGIGRDGNDGHDMSS